MERWVEWGEKVVKGTMGKMGEEKGGETSWQRQTLRRRGMR
jgi:hypothetical protein